MPERVVTLGQNEILLCSRARRLPMGRGDRVEGWWRVGWREDEAGGCEGRLSGVSRWKVKRVNDKGRKHRLPYVDGNDEKFSPGRRMKIKGGPDLHWFDFTNPQRPRGWPYECVRAESRVKEDREKS